MLQFRLENVYYVSIFYVPKIRGHSTLQSPLLRSAAVYRHYALMVQNLIPGSMSWIEKTSYSLASLGIHISRIHWSVTSRLNLRVYCDVMMSHNCNTMEICNTIPL